ncbi:MAG: U32 family peptidase [Prevotellaceae bacterium]|nr:U32 family peptidase [Prevotellaceae bacterium]
MTGVRKIELLAPAKNVACGIEAVNHGADAVYIGAPRFSARVAAGNSIDDIARLTAYAHTFNVRVYVALNTILRDDELPEAERIIKACYRIGVDALIVQDMGITRLDLPPIPLHASTQTDNRTAEKVRFLHDAGFRQTILARELSLEEITAIHRAVPDMALEVFVHGALCVSYSGQCYASQACFGRSANRGECAQFCRLPFTLTDAAGKAIVRDKYLLSLKDLNLLDELEALLDAGVTSLKIEGRLKELSYVKNVTAAYRQRLDALFARRKEYVRASSGQCRYTFEPSPAKSFNRGFTSYFLNGRDRAITSFGTPKSIGEEVGKLKVRRGDALILTGDAVLCNGDGLCYIDGSGALQGFRVNKVEGKWLYPASKLPRIHYNTPVYRNYDQAFERLLAHKSAERKIGIALRLAETAFGFSLTATDEEGNRVACAFPCAKKVARNYREGELREALSKWGNTPFELSERACGENAPLEIAFTRHWFIPVSEVTGWRRQVAEKLRFVRRVNYPQASAPWRETRHAYPASSLSYKGNVMNEQARRFYQTHGLSFIDPAFERQPVPGAALMTCKHCLRYSMGWCPVYQKRESPYKEPFYLTGAADRRFRLAFDCKRCQMEVIDLEERGGEGQ